MKPIESPWDLPDSTVTRAIEVDHDIRITDFALFATVPLRTLQVAGLPVNELTLAALVGLCLMRPARGGARLPSPIILLMAALLVLLTYSGYANGVEWTRRVGHVAILGGVIWAAGTGRISLRSAGLGLASGLLAVVALAVVKVGGDYYPGRLTGYLGDPNAGAYFIAVLGVLSVFFCDDRWKVQLAVAVPVTAGLVLSYSRTGLLAAAFAIIWVLVGRRLGVVGGAAMAAALVWLVGHIPDEATLFGPFSNRSGSDALRDRIIAAEERSLADAPWFGHGPGTAKVKLRGDLEFFFHNSYLAVRQEGGWPALVLVMGLLIYTFLLLSAQARRGDLIAAGAQAAILGTLVMAVTLGEVLLDTPAGLAIAFGLGHALNSANPPPFREVRPDD